MSQAIAIVVRPAMRDYLTARTSEDREWTHRTYYAVTQTFRQIYGEAAWRDTSERLMREFGLDDPRPDCIAFAES